MSSRRNPFDEIQTILDRMSQQFDRATEDLGSEFEPLFGRGVPVDLLDRGDEYVLRADLPGFETDDIDVRLSGSTVHIDATRDDPVEVATGSVVRHERRSRSVNRAVQLPGPVDGDGVSAEHANGVLTVTLPQRSGEDGRSIDVT